MGITPWYANSPNSPLQVKQGGETLLWLRGPVCCLTTVWSYRHC